ncbi:hypothetical protein [[Acidovorax] ebreus]|uniref:hypothetical protein n=1 Tax=Diaphorobacter sp. LI3 TaxID=2952886 RepID=UPI002054DFA8|nr:hypothetical protein MRB47_02520 [Diaphorobacter sp. LI3]
MSAPLVDFTLWALEQGATPGQVLTIDVDPDAGLLVSRWGDWMHTVPVALEISRLRQRTDPDMRAILAVHEAGHGLIYALLFQLAPLEIRINMATFSGGYNSFNALKVKTRNNLLDAVCVALAGRAAEEMVFGKESLSSGSETDLKLATQQMAAFIRHAAFGERISHVDVSTEAGENINTDVASTNAEIEAGLQKQYERAQGLLIANKALYLRMVNELVNKGQLEPQQIRDWLGLAQPQAPKDALEPFEVKLREFERRAA